MTLQQQLADRLHGVTWHNNYFSCECVFDSHDKPALLVYLDGYYCMSCGKGGTLEYLEKNISNLPTLKPSYTKSKILPRWRSWENRYGDMDGIAKAAHRNVLQGNNVYFKRRKLDQFIEKGFFGLLDGWIILPVFDQKREIVDIVARGLRQEGVKYVVRVSDNDNPRPMYSPDWTKVLNNQTVYVPFGLFDVWAFEAIGLPAITGITGKSINADQFSSFPTKNFIIVPDDGEERDAYRLANALGWRGSVLRLNYTDAKDPDEMRKSLSLEQWKNIVTGDYHATNHSINSLRSITG